MRPTNKLSIVLLVAVATIMAVGCGKLPTAPVSTAPTLGAQAAPASATTANRVVVERGDRQVQPSGLIGSVVGGLLNLIFKLLNVVGSIGGSLSNGRWQVDLPPGAISGSATIGLGVTGSSSASCALTITPADKNHFSVPARLTVHCDGVSSSELSTYVIFWHNPATGTWDPVTGSTVDLTSKTVSAPLQHFSDYAVGAKGGRAGW